MSILNELKLFVQVILVSFLKDSQPYLGLRSPLIFIFVLHSYFSVIKMGAQKRRSSAAV